MNVRLLNKLILMVFVFLPFSASAISVGDTVPSFKARTIDGDKSVALDDYRGKVVLIDFWASWCPPCLKSLPKYNELRKAIGTSDFEIVAINVDGSVSGVRVLKHKETPGLGDKIELRKSNWIKTFTGKIMTSDTDSRWHVVKDGGMFDQFTGATITPRAIVKAVKEAVIYFNKNQQTLFAKTSTCRGEQ